MGLLSKLICNQQNNLPRAVALVRRALSRTRVAWPLTSWWSAPRAGAADGRARRADATAAAPDALSPHEPRRTCDAAAAGRPPPPAASASRSCQSIKYVHSNQSMRRMLQTLQH